MPLPKPESGEEKQDFVSRCVSELHDKDEFSDNKQRLAVCFSQWERKNESIEYDDLDEATFKRVNRVRGGKVQRRKKVASKPGYKVQDGKVVKMKASEKLKRKRAAKKSARKRKGKQSQTNRKRKQSLRKRKSRGL